MHDHELRIALQDLTYFGLGGIFARQLTNKIPFEIKLKHGWSMIVQRPESELALTLQDSFPNRSPIIFQIKDPL